MRSVSWSPPAGVRLIDQRELPQRLVHLECATVREVADAIATMAVRGAPAIGATAAYGMALAARSDATLAALRAAKAVLDAARPTAVNLEWATAHMLRVAEALGVEGDALAGVLVREADELADDDVRVNRRMGANGAALIDGDAPNLLHHCNTGSLATVRYGTALGIVYALHEQGRRPHVWVDETRPRLQGARLTAWELMRAGVPMHLVADSASGLLMRGGRVDACVYGADRVAANGDVANKIGTYNLSVVARENGVPCYAAVPTSTIDLSVPDGDGIVIEERGADEVAGVGPRRTAPEGVQVFNPAFDVTPARYVTAIVTEEGVCRPPYEVSLRQAKERGEARVAAAFEARLAGYKAEQQ